MAEVSNADLIKQTAEATATSLNIQYIQRDIVDIKQAQKETSKKMEDALKGIEARDDSYVKKDEFIFWRNLLVSGILLTIFIGVVSSLIR